MDTIVFGKAGFEALPAGSVISLGTVVYVKDNPSFGAQWSGTDGSRCSDNCLEVIYGDDTAFVLRNGWLG